MTITGQNLLPRLNFPQVMVEKKKNFRNKYELYTFRELVLYVYEFEHTWSKLTRQSIKY